MDNAYFFPTTILYNFHGIYAGMVGMSYNFSLSRWDKTTSLLTHSITPLMATHKLSSEHISSDTQQPQHQQQ